MIPYNSDDNPEMVINDLRQLFVSEAAADEIGIPILDHVIVSKCGYYSYAANGKLDSLKEEA